MNKDQELKRFAIERSTKQGWLNLNEWCEDIPEYFDNLPKAVEQFEDYMYWMLDECHDCTCRLDLIGMNRKTVLMTESTL